MREAIDWLQEYLPEVLLTVSCSGILGMLILLYYYTTKHNRVQRLTEKTFVHGAIPKQHQLSWELTQRAPMEPRRQARVAKSKSVVLPLGSAQGEKVALETMDSYAAMATRIPTRPKDMGATPPPASLTSAKPRPKARNKSTPLPYVAPPAHFDPLSEANGAEEITFSSFEKDRIPAPMPAAQHKALTLELLTLEEEESRMERTVVSPTSQGQPLPHSPHPPLQSHDVVPPPTHPLGEILRAMEELDSLRDFLLARFSFAEVRHSYEKFMGVDFASCLGGIRHRMSSFHEDNDLEAWAELHFVPVLNHLGRFYSVLCEEAFKGNYLAVEAKSILHRFLFKEFGRMAVTRNWFILCEIIPFETRYDPRLHQLVRSVDIPRASGLVVSADRLGRIHPRTGLFLQKPLVCVGR